MPVSLLGVLDPEFPNFLKDFIPSSVRNPALWLAVSHPLPNAINAQGN